MVTVVGENGYLGSVVKRRWDELGITGDYTVNCIAPDDIDLTWRLAERGGLIQPSTDAIDEDTSYARTKRIVERAPGAVIIRTGIVDIYRQRHVAYRNWTCNPLTPLEWADLAAEMRDRPGVHAQGREPVSRFEVHRLVAEVFDLPAPIPAEADKPLDRLQPRNDLLPPLREALVEFREWLQS